MNRPYPPPCPPPCPPPPNLEQCWDNIKQFKSMVQELLSLLLNYDPAIKAQLQQVIAKLLVSDPELTVLRQIVYGILTTDPTVQTLLQTVVNEMITSNPTTINNITQLIQTTPKIGVTNGSNAAPGQVGEFLRGASTVNFAGHPNVTNTTATPLTVSAGDWDLFGFVTISAGIGAMDVACAIPGLSDSFFMQEGTTGGVDYTISNLTTVRGSFSATTALVFSVMVNQGATTTPPLTAGSLDIIVGARRAR